MAAVSPSYKSMQLLGLVVLCLWRSFVQSAYQTPPLYELRTLTLNDVFSMSGKWAESLDADPLRIENELHMKGVKHYVEYISLLFEMQPTANASVRAWSQEALQNAHAVSTTVAYHDNVLKGALVHKTEPKKFRADSISYLRACMIFRNAGLDTTYYQQRIDELKPILDVHVPTRGIMQRLAFGLLYEELGLKTAPSMQFSFEEEMKKAWRATSIRQRRELDWYVETKVTPSRIYQITHEVFETTNTGNHAFSLGEEDRLYGLEILIQLMKFKIDQMSSRRERSLDADHMCELVMSYACFADTRTHVTEPARSLPDPSLQLPSDHVEVLVKSMQVIMARQLDTGAFGTLFTKKFEEINKKYHNNEKHDVMLGAALHCTSVCLRACSLIYRFPQIQQRVFADEPLHSGQVKLPEPPKPAAVDPMVSLQEIASAAAAASVHLGGTASEGTPYGSQRQSAGFQTALYFPAGAEERPVYQRRGRSDEDLVPSTSLNDPIRSEDIVRQVKFVIEAHGGGFRRELLEDIMMTMLEFSDTVY